MLIHTQAADRKTVTGHYDRGNDFFNAFLGDIMIYTSAFFESPADTLEDAQRRKLEVVAKKIQLKPGERLLDIGCGWGTLVAHMAEHYGADATGVTLAARQAEFGAERIAKKGLADKRAHPDPGLPGHPPREVEQDHRAGDGRARRESGSSRSSCDS